MLVGGQRYRELLGARTVRGMDMTGSLGEAFHESTRLWVMGVGKRGVRCRGALVRGGDEPWRMLGVWPLDERY